MKIGELDVSKIMLGSTEITSIYLGANQVYDGGGDEPSCNCNCTNCTTSAITYDVVGLPVCSLTLDMNDPNRVNSNFMLFDDELCDCDQELDYVVNTMEGYISVIDGNGMGEEIAKYYFETDGTDNGDGTYTISFNGAKIYPNSIDENCGLYGCFTCGCGEEDPDCSHCDDCDPCDDEGECYDPCSDPDSPCYDPCECDGIDCPEDCDPCDPEGDCYDECQCDPCSDRSCDGYYEYGCDEGGDEPSCEPEEGCIDYDYENCECLEWDEGGGDEPEPEEEPEE